MATHTKSICGITFELNAPYTEGHTLTAAEALVLNQCRAENIGNNLRATIAEKVAPFKGQELPENVLAEIRNLVAEADQKYAFGQSHGGGGPRGPVDPVKSIAMGMAEADVRAAVAARGVKVSAKQIAELAKNLFAKKETQYREKAQRQMKNAAKESADLLSDLGLADAA